MRFTSAMLCDAAQVSAGKLFVMGGAFDTISSRSFPAVHRSLTLALVAEVGPADRNRDLGLVITLLTEDGEETGDAAVEPLVVQIDGSGHGQTREQGPGAAPSPAVQERPGRGQRGDLALET